jgi:hypothetical protein
VRQNLLSVRFSSGIESFLPHVTLGTNIDQIFGIESRISTGSKMKLLRSLVLEEA